MMELSDPCQVFQSQVDWLEEEVRMQEEFLNNLVSGDLPDDLLAQAKETLRRLNGRLAFERGRLEECRREHGGEERAINDPC
jgi:hypothetical protein